MPILKIKIDEEYLEFKIIPINKEILTSIFLRLKVDRLGFMAHTIKSPKMMYLVIPIKIIILMILL